MQWTKEDFSEDELVLLRMAFRMLDEAIDAQRELMYGADYRNEVYYLKEKLGIYDLVS